MKRKLIALSQSYAAALQTHLKKGPRAGLRPARGLGRQAVRLGLETLDLARIHERALAMLDGLISRDGIYQRAELFFTEAIAPIEKTHRAVLDTHVRLNQLSKMLDRRTIDLAAANQSLKLGIARRKSVEKALKTSGGHSARLLDESHHLHKRLRHLTHQILSAQEGKRKKISHDLQDEIAQTLLAINVRLITLKQSANVNAGGLQKEIASTRRLVDKSMKSINRFTREVGKHHET